MERRAECVVGHHPFRDFYSEGSRGCLQVWAEEKQYLPSLVEESLWLPDREWTVPEEKEGSQSALLL